MKEFVAGFDPGGQRKFGWCLFKLTDLSAKIDAKNGIVDVASCADEAFNQMKRRLNEESGCLVAAGIDAPLYWTRKGNCRESDKWVRKQIREQICEQNPGDTTKALSTVQAVNSLRGACLIQGLFLAKRIESEYSKCKITETHPKALLKTRLKTCSEMEKFKNKCDEDKRDAIISAWAAVQYFQNKDNQNLFERDKKEELYTFLEKTMYWWPD